ncbi:PEP-CTERM sorting domain-containing protein [Thiohalorhabdus methylotrophus]|uniref:PEP-CTERM sorting domain-containing protein n=1 Tax=Thiohalorhabdus methylotrophus TaxID=3242694 RepID=A0ABV4U0F0_9GAMM
MQNLSTLGKAALPLVGLGSLFLLAGDANAAAYGESAPLTGVRDNFDIGGLEGSNRWSGDSADERMTLSWDITQVNSSWEYEYTWSGTEAALDKISHFTLDVTDNCYSDADCVTEANAATEYIDMLGQDPGEQPEDFENLGVKFDQAQAVYSFTSNRAPVWGDLCLKDGDGPDTCANLSDTDGDDFYEYTGDTTLLWNTGFANRDSQNTLYYVARPDAVDNGNGDNGNGDNGNGDNGNGEPIPAPGTLALLAMGMLGAGVSGGRFKKS